MTIRSLSLELDLDAGKFTANMTAATGATTNFSQKIDDTAARLKNIESAVAGPTARLRDFTLIVSSARDALETLDAVFFGWAESMVTASAQIEKTSKMLSGMSDAIDDLGKAKDAQKQLDYIFNMAKTAPFSLHGLTDAFVKLKSAGLDPMDGTLNGIVEAVARFGGSDQAMERAALAIQQMAGKGVVSMEELRRQLGEAVPTAINMMAAGMGMSYAALVKAISNGTVESQGAISKMVAMFNLAYGGSAQAQMQTFAGKMAVLKTGFIQLSNAVVGLDESGNTVKDGFFDNVKKGLDAITAAMQNPEVREFGRQLGSAMAEGTKDLIGFVEGAGQLATVIPVLTIVKDAFKALAVVLAVDLGKFVWDKIAASISTLISAFGTLGGASSQLGRDAVALFQLWKEGSITMTGAATAAELAGTSLKAFGVATLNVIPVIGTIAAVLYTLADSFGLFTDKTDAAAKAWDNFKAGLTTDSDIKAQAASVGALKQTMDLMKSEGANRVPFAASASGFRDATPEELIQRTAAIKAATDAYNEANNKLNLMRNKFADDTAASDGKLAASLAVKSAGLDKVQQQIKDTANDLEKFVIEHKGDADADKLIADQKAKNVIQLTALNDQYAKGLQKLIDDDTKALKGLSANDPKYKTIVAARNALIDQQKTSTYGHDIASLAADDRFVNGKGKTSPGQDRLSQMIEQAAGLRAKLADSGSEVAKMMAALNTDPKLMKSAPELKKQLMDAAAAVDALTRQNKSKTADDKLKDEVTKQGDAVATATKQMDDLVAAQGQGSITSGEYAASMDKAAQKALEFDKNSQSLADTAKDQKKQYDALNLSMKDYSKLGSEVTGAQAEAKGLFDDLARGQDTASLTLERYKKSMQELVQGVLPQYRAQAQQLADQAVSAFSAVQAGKAVEEMRSKVKSINAEIELDASEKARVQTQNEVDEMFKRIDWAKLTADQRKLVEKDYYDFVAAEQKKQALQSRGPIEQMADQWTQLGQNMQQAATGWIGSFVDGIATGKLSFKSFVTDVLQGIAKVILQALIAKAIIAAIGAFFPGASAITVPSPASMPTGPAQALGMPTQIHTGGIVGEKGLASMTVPASIFNDAFRYHTGGVAGLRPGEVPAVLEQGEGVFTKEQMAALGNGDGKAPNVTVNVINQSGTQMTAQQKQPRFDAKGMILDVVIDAMSKPGKMRDAVKGTALGG